MAHDHHTLKRLPLDGDKPQPDLLKEGTSLDDNKVLTELSSTNQVFLEENLVGRHLILAITVSAIQIGAFLRAGIEAVDSGPPHQNLTSSSVLVRLLISLYLPAMMVLAINPTFWLPSYCAIWTLSPNLWRYPTWQNYFRRSLYSIVVVLILPIGAFLSIICDFDTRDKDLRQLRANLAVIVDYVVIAAGFWATLAITIRHDSMINSLFNFAGLLIVLDLDKAVAKMLHLRVALGTYEIKHTALSLVKVVGACLAKTHCDKHASAQHSGGTGGADVESGRSTPLSAAAEAEDIEAVSLQEVKTDSPNEVPDLVQMSVYLAFVVLCMFYLLTGLK